MQHRDEHDQCQDVEGIKAADGDNLVLHGFHVEDPEGNHEEGQIADQEDQPGGTPAPPGIVPGESASCIEHIFNEHAESRPGDGDEPAIGDAQDLGLLFRQEHLGPDDPGDGEHKADLDVQTDEDEEGGLSRRSPDRGVICEMEDQAVPDLVEPVHAPKSQAGKDEVPVALFGFDGVDVEDKRKHGDDIPDERLAALP